MVISISEMILLADNPVSLSIKAWTQYAIYEHNRYKHTDGTILKNRHKSKIIVIEKKDIVATNKYFYTCLIL